MSETVSKVTEEDIEKLTIYYRNQARRIQHLEMLLLKWFAWENARNDMDLRRETEKALRGYYP